MANYTYKALSSSGEVVKGEASAHSLDELNLLVESKGYLLQSARFKKNLFGNSAKRRIKPDIFMLFNQELMALLKSGISITGSLEELSDRPDQPYLSNVIKDILSQVTAGASLSAACRRFPDIFDPLYISALETGESAGDMVSTLARYQKQLQNKITLQRQLSQAMMYPAFLLVLLFFVLLVLFVFVLPRFVALYADFDTELPLPTKWLMTVIEYSPIWGAILVVVFSIAVLSYKFYVASSDKRSARMDYFLLNIPLIGSIIELRTKAQMSRTMATLLASGVPMIEAMKKTINILSNRSFANKLELARESVAAGMSFSFSLEKYGLISGSAYKILKSGEKAGNIVSMLDEISDYLEQILSHRLNRFTGLLEPLLMLFVGVIVGGIILIIYLPIFSMAEVIQ